jgi:hypothetical protein
MSEEHQTNSPSDPQIPDLLRGYMNNGFPEAIKLNDHGDVNVICRMCGEWVVENSSVSNRYHVIQGSWKDDQLRPNDPDSFEDPEHGSERGVPVCDKCASNYEDIGGMKEIGIMGYTFRVGGFHRAND